MLNIFFEGFLLQASLIMALGAQNIYVLESGIYKRFVVLNVLLCSLIDFVLIFLGIFGVSTFLKDNENFKIAIAGLGILFLLYYGIMKLISKESMELDLTEASQQHSLKKTISMILGFSLLNPHVYLDTIVLIGGYSLKYEDLNSQISFGLGAGIFSTLWFVLLVVLAGPIRKHLRPESFRWINIGTGLVLILLGIKLSFDVISWLKL